VSDALDTVAISIWIHVSHTRCSLYSSNIMVGDERSIVVAHDPGSGLIVELEAHGGGGHGTHVGVIGGGRRGQVKGLDTASSSSAACISTPFPTPFMRPAGDEASSSPS
jgi:hypothetical protein